MKDQNISDLGIKKEDLEGLNFDFNVDKDKTLVESSPVFEYSRPVSDYATIDTITAHLLATGDKTQNVPSESLRVNGHAVQEAMEKYLGATDYFSSSVLKMAKKSPLHLFYEWESGWKEKMKKLEKQPGYFDLGTYLHECILEPTKFSRVVAEPEANRATTIGMNLLVDFWEALVMERIDDCNDLLVGAREQLSDENYDLDKLNGKNRYCEILMERTELRAVSHAHKLIIDCAKFNFDRYGDGVLHRILKHSKREISIYGEDPETGMKVKIRPDAIAFKENIGVDAIISAKTTSKENLRQYAYHSASLEYPLSEGMYQEVASQVTGRDFCATINIVIQTVPPFGVMALFYGPDDIEAGKYKYHHALRTAKECIDKNHWPGYDAFAEEGNMGLINFEMPAFYRSMEETPVSI